MNNFAFVNMTVPRAKLDILGLEKIYQPKLFCTTFILGGNKVVEPFVERMYSWVQQVDMGVKCTLGFLKI